MAKQIVADTDILQEFFSNANKTNYCWHWKGPLDYDGYAVVDIGEQVIPAIQILYEIMRGSLSSITKLKQDCNDLRCVNPDHIVVHDGINTPITFTNRLLPIHKPSRPPHYRYKRSLENGIKQFWENVRKTEGCWIWTGTLNGKYGNFNLSIGGRNQVLAHRISFLLADGVIPKGFELDHLCRNTICVKPKHLEAVTHAENIRRSLPYRKSILNLASGSMQSK